jgi:hypothetical protein
MNTTEMTYETIEREARYEAGADYRGEDDHVKSERC